MELNTLRQGQLVTPVDGIGLAAHICLPAIRAAFTATTRFLFTTKGTTSTYVDVGYTAITARCREELFGFAHVQRHQR